MSSSRLPRLTASRRRRRGRHGRSRLRLAVKRLRYVVDRHPQAAERSPITRCERGVCLSGRGGRCSTASVSEFASGRSQSRHSKTPAAVGRQSMAAVSANCMAFVSAAADPRFGVLRLVAAFLPSDLSLGRTDRRLLVQHKVADKSAATKAATSRRTPNATGGRSDGRPPPSGFVVSAFALRSRFSPAVGGTGVEPVTPRL